MTDVVDNHEANRFEARVDGELAGYAVYRRDAETVSFTHTQVESGFEGRGVGSALVGGALEATREAGLAVLPFCPFVRSYIRRHPEYAELVPADRRKEFELENT